MPDLTEFLLARIAEDEKVATDLRDQYPHDPGPTYLSDNWDLIEVTTGYARVLAECEAKRQIVEDFQHLSIRPGALAAHSEWTCRRLATIYADHPDFREEWRA